MDGSPLVDQILPSRRAAKEASANFAAQLQDSDSDNPISKRGRRTTSLKYVRKRRNAQVLSKKATSSTRQVKVSPLLQGSQLHAEPTTMRPAPRPVYSKKPSLAPLKPESENGDGSDLTSLSSPTLSRDTAQNSLLARSSLDHVDSLPRGRDHTVTSATTSCAVLHGQPQEMDQAWDVIELGTYVWVLLDQRARVFEPQEDDHLGDRLWWPGKITSTRLNDIPLNVHLFGTAAPGVKNVEIHKPCAHNILSLENSMQRARFDSPTFVTASYSGDSVHESPRKRQKRDRADHEDRWRVALAEMAQEREEEDESDVMPAVGTLGFVAYVSPISKVLGGNQKQSVESEKDLDLDLDLNRWSPPPPDSDLQIPGEVVLAREGNHATVYWPAKILQYIPPKKRKQQGKYKVEFLDTAERNIPRSYFYTTDEDSFATCTLGKWESEFHEVVNDRDEEADEDFSSHNRSPSPLPSDPPPHPHKFISLNIRNQFVYTKNVLKAILNVEYKPARRRHDLFIGGGAGRKSVVDEAGMRGRMDPKDVAELEKYLREWCLRDEQRAEVIVDEGEEIGPEEASSAFMAVTAEVVSLSGMEGFNASKAITETRCPPSPTATEHALSLSPSDLPPSSSPDFLQESEPPPMSFSSCSGSITGSVHDSGGNRLSTVVAPIVCDSDPPNPRQRGCPAYEALAGVEKIDYCLNVLLPEAIIQTLLWRGGHRSSVELLSEAEEEALHEKGDELIRETDWVFDVMRLRMAKARQLAKTAQTKENVIEDWSKRRSRRTVGMANYQE